jgi:hypothetical protein
VSPTTGLAGHASVFVTLTSAAGIVVTTDAVRSPVSGSVVPDVTAALFVSVPDTVVTTRTVSTRLAPLANAPIAGHVTTPLECDPEFVALTNVTVAGSVSVTTTVAALDGPAFDTVIT